MLFKKTAEVVSAPMFSLDGILQLLVNVWFWATMILYAVATLLWISILQKIPLSLAYPFTALGFVLIPLVGWFFFQEVITWSYVLGGALILAGLGVIMMQAN